MFGNRSASTCRMSSHTAGSPVRSQLGRDRERDLVARRELVHEALACASYRSAPSPRTASVTRKPSRSPSQPQRGRVELHELEVGQQRPGVAGQAEPGADRPARVRRALPERGRAAGGEDHRARRHRERAALAPASAADAAAVARHRQRARRDRLEHLDGSFVATSAGQRRG